MVTMSTLSVPPSQDLTEVLLHGVVVRDCMYEIA